MGCAVTSTDHWFERLAHIAHGRELSRPSDNAHPSRVAGTPPAPTVGGAVDSADVRDELTARRDTRPLGNVVRLPVNKTTPRDASNVRGA